MEPATPELVYVWGSKPGRAGGNEGRRVEVDARPVFRGLWDTISSVGPEGTAYRAGNLRSRPHRDAAQPKWLLRNLGPRSACRRTLHVCARERTARSRSRVTLST